MIDKSTVLFICTGNYYRSRFAEALFNYRAEQLGLPWTAFSRGLDPSGLRDDLSPHTERALLERGIPLSYTGPTRVALTEADLLRATRVIAVKRDEHHPYMRLRFPEWADRIEYWHVNDLDKWTVDIALLTLEQRVEELLDQLSRQHTLEVPVRAGAHCSH